MSDEEHGELIEADKQDYEEYLSSDKTLVDSTYWFALQTLNGGDKRLKITRLKKSGL